MICKVLFYNSELFYCFVIATGLCFNCFSYAEYCPNSFNLNSINPTAVPTQQDFEASVSTKSQKLSKGFDPNFNSPTQQDFEASVSTKNSEQFSKGIDLNFNNPTRQALETSVSTQNSKQFSKGFDLNFKNPTQQTFEELVSAKNNEQFSRGFNLQCPSQQAFQALNPGNSPQLFENSFDQNINNPNAPLQQDLGPFITSQLTNGFNLNFRNPVSPFQQVNRDPNTKYISPPLGYVRDPLPPPLFSNEKQLPKNDDTQNILKQRHETLGNGNYKTIVKTSENGGRRLEGEKEILGKAAGTLKRDGGECVVSGDNGRLLWKLREPESFPRLQQKQRFSFPLQFQAPIKFRTNMFNRDWSDNNAGIDHYDVQNMAKVPNIKKDLFDRDLNNNNNGFDEFRNVYNGKVQTPEIAYNDFMNEYDQKVSTIPNNEQENIPHITQNAGEIGNLNEMKEYYQKTSTVLTKVHEDTPHITHNADKIARLNQIIELELNGEGELKRQLQVLRELWQKDFKKGVD